MSSPSASSSASSGRSSPDPTVSQAPNARRGSAPASAFLAPRFWHSNSTGMVPTTSTVSSPSWDAWSHTQLHQGGAGALPPRRTSFGTALGGGGRLSALSALGMSAPPAQHHLQHHQQHMAQHQWHHHSLTAPRSPTKSTASLSSTTSAPPTPMPPPTQAASETPRSNSKDTRPAVTLKPKRSNVCFLPGPDGICVETRRRRGSQSQA